jgi:Holliday junction resolvase-like predicted endonuclease
MEHEWVVIARFFDDVKCQIAVDQLHNNEIEAVAIDKRDWNYRFGEIELCVHRDNVIAAKEIIKDL